MKLLAVILFLLTLLPDASAQEEGFASYYHHRMHGRMTASGKRHDRFDFVAAHRTLPFGTYVRVTNLDNMKSIVVEITDRGPRRRKRIIDVSYSAAVALDFVKKGITRVRIEEVPGPIDYRYLELIYPDIKLFDIEKPRTSDIEKYENRQ